MPLVVCWGRARARDAVAQRLSVPMEVIPRTASRFCLGRRERSLASPKARTKVLREPARGVEG